MTETEVRERPYSQSKEGRRAYYQTRKDDLNAARRQRYAEDAAYRQRILAAAQEARLANIEAARAFDRSRAARCFVNVAKTQCQKCGYNQSRVALQWHHVDPSTKACNPSELRRAPDDVAAEELRKCVQVCANCHWEAESGLWCPDERMIEENISHIDALLTDRKSQ